MLSAVIFPPEIYLILRKIHKYMPTFVPSVQEFKILSQQQGGVGFATIQKQQYPLLYV
jgi:hypothetical protein